MINYGTRRLDILLYTMKEKLLVFIPMVNWLLGDLIQIYVLLVLAYSQNNSVMKFE